MIKVTQTMMKLADQYLHPGEQVIAGLRVNPLGTAIGLGLTGGIGGLAGLVVGSKVVKEGQEQFEEAGIPIERQAALGLTNQRLTIWKCSAVSGMPTETVGEIPLSKIVGVEFKSRLFGDRLTLTFRDGNVLELEAVKVDKGQEFARLLDQAIKAGD
ncbi:MAG: PH domain-containing protein [Chloroflexota bacterium]